MSNSKPKVLILQGEVSTYRVATYNIIADNFDVTVGYYDKDKSVEECRFKKIKLDSYKLGPFICIKSLRKFCKQFDVVIFMDDLHALSYCLLPFGPRKFKTISWGFGLRASYTRLYDVDRCHTFLDKVSQVVNESCDAIIFYMEKAKEFWRGTSFDMGKVFVAPNTTAVESIEIEPLRKKNLLFVGTLYEKKGIMALLQAYQSALCQSNNLPMLHIVGDGVDAEKLKQYVSNNGLSNRVIFHGAIYDEKKLAQHFRDALLCISPHQAGLSVPKSMGYGVPFVTLRDAITGGEKYHITHGETGVFYEQDEDLVSIILDAASSPEKYVKLGVNAKAYYDNTATPKHMAQGAIDAINFVLNRLYGGTIAD